MTSEIIQQDIHNVIWDITGAKNFADDILIFSRNQEQHDIALKATLQILEEKGLTLNNDKCGFNKDKFDFYSRRIDLDRYITRRSKTRDQSRKNLYKSYRVCIYKGLII